MSEIHNLESGRMAQPVTGPGAASGRRSRAVAAPAERAVAREVDAVEFSPAAVQLAESAPQSAPALRLARIARIRAEIQNGTYDVNGKLEAVLGRVLADVLGRAV